MNDFDPKALSDEELEALLLNRTAPEAVVAGAPLTDHRAVFAWAKEHYIEAGRILSLTADDLLRHFEQWAAPRGHSISAARRGLIFGEALNRLGLRKGRKVRNGIDTRPRKMSSASAEYFLEWLEANPRPADFSTTTMPRWATKGEVDGK